ncbi:multidrug resistance-associated protein 1 [Trichomycterus rosablanca]|uniref:multidrug resistance-associated protein 1 n=1 Tax=Trichomycterus rosablanca TaxID=2290929 RepID=UPI002F351E32
MNLEKEPEGTWRRNQEEEPGEGTWRRNLEEKPGGGTWRRNQKDKHGEGTWRNLEKEPGGTCSPSRVHYSGFSRPMSCNWRRFCDLMIPDWNRTWYTSSPDLTLCFQNTLLIWIPSLYLLVCGNFYLVYLRSLRCGCIRVSVLYWAKTVLGVSLACFGVLELFHFLVYRSVEIIHHVVFLLNPVVRILSMVLVMYIIHLERVKGRRSSLFLFLFWMLAVICSLVPLRRNVQNIVNQDFSGGVMTLVVFFIRFSLQLAQLILCCFADQRPHPPRPAHQEENPCPVERASFLSKALFWWFVGLVWRGYHSPLTAEDLWSLREEDTSQKIMSDLEREWITQRAALQQERSVDGTRAPSFRITQPTPIFQKLRQEQGGGFLLLRVLVRTFGSHFLAGTLCLIVHDVVMFSIPQVLRLLLGVVGGADVPRWRGYLFAVVLFLLSCLQSLFNHQYMYSCFTVGMRVKTGIMGLVYRKSLVISSDARRTCTVGEMVNLASTDTQKLMDFVVYFNAVWLAPVEIGLCFFFLWQHLGASALAGLATVIFIFPLNGLIAKIRNKLQEVQMKNMDGRIKLMNEILNGIKILKFYAWEKAFERKILNFREKELAAMKTSQILYSVSIASFNSSTFLVAFTMFSVYVSIHEENVLDAEKIFVSMALINILKTPLSQLPFSISTITQAIVSLRRLEKFLCQDELREDAVIKAPHSPDADSIVIENGSFSWSRDGAPCLKRVNVRVPPGLLVAVVGPVGSGKSSLLSAVLGEMEKKSGNVTVRGSVAYVPQQAWIQNATLRENIVFEQQKNESSYQKVLEACALLPDLEILPGGDDTEIGEKGLNLSGGQKHRVSLARAVYRNADVYLLDDPLSGVDTHVGQHVFHSVLGPAGVLRNKTRVLVTHGLGLLPHTDLILVMKDGRITETGSYSELLTRRNSFSHLLKTFSNQERRERNRGTRMSASCLGLNDFSIDLSQEQLIRGDVGGAGVQTVEAVPDSEQEQDTEELSKLTRADRAHTGRVKPEVYMEYLRTVSLAYVVPIVVLYAVQQAASFGYNYWLRLWADAHETDGSRSDSDVTLAVFGALGFTQGFTIFCTTVAISLGGVMASRQLHLDLLRNVLRSHASFFESTPSGNMLNRFSREMDAIDCMIPDAVKTTLGYAFKLLEVCVVVLVATPFAGLVILPLAFFYTFIQRIYVATSCQLRRLEAVSRSPIYTHLNETVQGASVIRSFGEQTRFVLQADGRVDHNQTSYFPRFVATRWLAVNLEVLGNLLVLTAAVLSVMRKESLSPGLVGLAVSHSLQVTGILSWMVRAWTDVENNIVSVERVKEYTDTPKEAAWVKQNTRLSSDWPRTGTIQFHQYGMQYRRGLDWALKNITFSIGDREKIGIVGRTGAGKSSLTLGIFRILEAVRGRIYIDGVNIAELGLHELRSRITIIPQDPVLFSGSLRMNLDPFDGYSDEEVWRALELAHLKSFVSGLQEKLNHECSEGGENLSLGQRQLVCLARALLRKTKILVLDEATAAVDLETDELIQSTIRTQFSQCTVLTIAHRLNTIMDYTRVMVMDGGSITEMDTPTNLLSQRGSFYSMCREAGLV